MKLDVAQGESQLVYWDRGRLARNEREAQTWFGYRPTCHRSLEQCLIRATSW